MIHFLTKNTLFSYLTLIIIVISGCRKSDYFLENTELVRDNGAGTGNATWFSDKTYIIDGLVFVNDGQTLTIQAGAVIKGNTSSRNSPSALVVARGGTIIAEGKPDNPIIFTSVQDEPTGTLPFNQKGLWGGVIILGNAPVNSNYGEAFIEGIPISEPRGVYGGNNEDDNSGIFSYVSIRHAGIDIGEENEINGLTLGGVGRKTKIDHVEIISSNDDGFEFFGGNVSCKNLVAAFCKDDAFDFDEGYSGKLQFILGIKDMNEGDCLAEHSDFRFASPMKPVSFPTIYNATFIGNGKDDTHPLIRFFENGAGIYRNSIFLNSKTGILIEHREQETSSYSQFLQGKIKLSNNIFNGVAGEVEDSILRVYSFNSPGSEVSIPSEYFTEEGNEMEDVGIDVSKYPYDLFPASTLFESLSAYDYPWYDDVSYKGAFGSNNWLEGWSILWERNIIR